MPILLFPYSSGPVGGYFLGGLFIKTPESLSADNQVSHAMQRSMTGRFSSDLFDTGKRIWSLAMKNLTQTELDVIMSKYNEQVNNDEPITFQSTDDEYIIPTTRVWIDDPQPEIQKGGSYLRSLDLTLQEV